MPPQPIQAPAAPTSTGSPQALDPQVVALAKAVRQIESGGNPTAVGKSGEYGAYQYEPGTWAVQSKAAGVNVPLQQATLAQQNQVWYTWAKAQKDAGKNVGQIASMQNAGEGEPDAYTGKFSNGQPSKGTNPEGVPFDVPEYAKEVAKTYQQYKSQSGTSGNAADPTAPAPQRGLADKVKNVLTSIFPGTEQIGESLGTAAFDVGQIAQGKNPFANPTKTGGVQDSGENPASQVNIPKTIGGYLEAGSQVGTPGAGAETAAGRIATTVGIGAIAGAGGALAGGSTSAGDILKQAATGGAIGGAIGGTGELLSKAAQYLPYSIVRKFIPGINGETAQYAVDKGLGSPTGMLNKSTASLSKIGSGIESVLTDPSLEGIAATTQDIYPSILDKYPNAGLTPDNVGDELKKLVPLQKSLVDKLEAGGLEAKELNQLKSALGTATYKNAFDEPAVKAGKQIGNAAYSSISKWLTDKVPDAAPLFDEYSKELQLNGALQKLIRSGEKKKFFGLPELVALVGGAPLGIGGGLGAVALEKAYRSPTVNLVAGGLINKVATPAQTVGRAAVPFVSGLLNQNKGK